MYQVIMVIECLKIHYCASNIYVVSLLKSVVRYVIIIIIKLFYLLFTKTCHGPTEKLVFFKSHTYTVYIY